MSDIKALRPLSRTSAHCSSRPARRAQACEGARLRGGRRRRRPRGRRHSRPEGRGARDRAAGAPARCGCPRERRRHPLVRRRPAAVAQLELVALVLPKATPEAVAALGPDGPPRDRDRRDGAGPAPRLRDGRAARASPPCWSARSTWAWSSAGSPAPTASSSSTRARRSLPTRPRRGSARRSTSSTSTSATVPASRRPRASHVRSASGARPASTPTRWR